MASKSLKDYAELRTRFANWLLMPNRQPATQKAWCKQYGVAEATASGWRRDPDVVAKLTVWKDIYTGAFPEVMHSLHRQAVGGGPRSVQAARLEAEILGMNRERAADAPVMDLASFLQFTTPDPARVNGQKQNGAQTDRSVNNNGQSTAPLANPVLPTTSSPRGLLS